MNTLRQLITDTSARINAAVATRLDRAFVHFAFRTPPGADQVPPADRMTDLLDEAAPFYDRAARTGALFQPPSRPRVEMVQVRSRYAGHGAAYDLSWPSGYSPLHPRYAQALAQCPETRTCHARWFKHDDPAPAMICLHGWGAGEYTGEQLAFPVRWMFSRCQLDVVLMNMPFHARRKAGLGRSTPAFPTPDPTRSVEGFAHAIQDARTLIDLLLDRGAPWVGVMGMSLGGYTSALLATVEPRLACAVPLMPFASLPELIWRHGHDTPSQRTAIDAGVTLERLALAMRSVSPLDRPARIDTSRILIGAGERDGITLTSQARKLYDHFQGSHLCLFPGGHLYQYGRRRVFAAFHDLQRQIRHDRGEPLTIDLAVAA